MGSIETKRTALILGASSGFGEAAALEFARAGYDIIGVHLDRRAGLALYYFSHVAFRLRVDRSFALPSCENHTPPRRA